MLGARLLVMAGAPSVVGMLLSNRTMASTAALICAAVPASSPAAEEEMLVSDSSSELIFKLMVDALA